MQVFSVNAMVIDHQVPLLSVRIKTTIPPRELPINILYSLLAKHLKILPAMNLIIGGHLLVDGLG